MRKALLAVTMLWPVVASAQTAQQCPTARTAGTTAPVSTAGYFTTSGTEILDPAGKPFIAHGLNVYFQDLPTMITNSSAQPLLTTFPGTNLVRIGVQDLTSATVAALQPYIATLSALGIVAEIEDWNYPTTDINASTQFIKQLAASTLGNPYVWYASPNEPASAGLAQSEIVATYNAVRSTGNKTIVLMMIGSATEPTNVDLSAVSNVAWTVHFYAWIASYSTSLAVQAAALNKIIAMQEAVDPVPVVIDEYGDNCCGTIDQGWQEVVTAVQQSGWGTAAFVWNGPMVNSWGSTTDPLLNTDGSLNAYGEMVAPYIASSGATSQGNYVTQAYTKQLCQLSQTAYPTVLSDAATAEQEALTTAEQQAQKPQAVGTAPPAAAASVLPAPSAAAPATQAITTPPPATVMQVTPTASGNTDEQPTTAPPNGPIAAEDASVIAEIDNELGAVQAQIQAITAQLTALTGQQAQPAVHTASVASSTPAPAATPILAPLPENSSTGGGGSDGAGGGGGDAR